MGKLWRHSFVMLSVGFFYGASIGFLAFISLAFGHGTMLPSVLSSAPLGLFGSPVLYIAGGPIVWSFLFFVAARVPKSPRTFLTSMGLYYAGAVTLLIRLPTSQWQHFMPTAQKMPEVFVAWAGLYGTGQAGLWLFFKRNRSRQPSEMRPLAGSRTSD